MNSKIIKVKYKNEDGLDLFKEYPAPDDAFSISEVELIQHTERDTTMDLVKGRR